jgi:osmotically-inducible protein OsmY
MCLYATELLNFSSAIKFDEWNQEYEMADSSEVLSSSRRCSVIEAAINHALRKTLHMWWGLVNVEVNDDGVLLTGYVQGRQKKQEILTAISAIEGVGQVVDELTIVDTIS